MSHHFDTPTAREDARINLCDFYLFRVVPDTVVMALTVNPNAGVASPDTFRDEGIYAFRFDLNGDACEEVTFKVRFGDVRHSDEEEHKHVQSVEVRRATGASAQSGIDGELIASGHTGDVVTMGSGIRVYAGLVADLFAGDAAALGVFRNSFFNEGKFNPGAFTNRKNFFAGHNVSAIVLEVPTTLIGQGNVRAWATISLYGHAPEVQVSRWGLPLITNIFMPDQTMREDFNRAAPGEDLCRFANPVSEVVEKLTTLARSTASPADYARQFIARLFPVALPYELNTDAAFDLRKINGRALADDVMDVILSLATNTTLGDGVAPDQSLIRTEFPYFGEPHKVVPAANPAPDNLAGSR